MSIDQRPDLKPFDRFDDWCCDNNLDEYLNLSSEQHDEYIKWHLEMSREDPSFKEMSSAGISLWQSRRQLILSFGSSDE